MKRTPTKAFENVNNRGLIMMSLRNNDSLRWVRHCKASDELVMSTRYYYYRC